MRVAQIVEATEAEGPGVRFALWLQGCPLRCAGCCNPQMLPMAGGVEMSVDAVVDRIGAVEGITLLGGEPFAQASEAAQLCAAVRERGLSVMIFTGFTREELRARQDDATERLLSACDLLVDGPYDRHQPDEHRRWIGSTNQRMHFLSNRYDAADPIFVSANTVEIRLRRGEVTVNGWPALARALCST